MGEGERVKERSVSYEEVMGGHLLIIMVNEEVIERVNHH